MNKRNVATLGVAALTIFAILAAVFTLGGPQVAALTCDTGSLRSFAEAAYNQGDNATGRYRDQEANACLETGDAQGAVATSSSTPGKPLGSSTSSSPTTGKKADDKQPVDDSYEFLANRPADEKVALNAFGPKVSLLAAPGKNMGELTVDEAVREHEYARTVDPMQTASQAASLGLIKGEEIDTKTKLYVSNFAARKAMNTQITSRFNTMKKEVRVIPAGTPVSAQYALPDDTPHVRTDGKVVFPYDIHALVYTDEKGVEYGYRLECYFQFLRLIPGSKAMPAPSPGMTRTPEGTPTKEKPKETPSTTPSNSGTTQSTPPKTTPPTTPPSTPVCTPPGRICETKTGPQPSGVGHPTNNPVGSVEPSTTKSKPLDTHPPAPSPTTSRHVEPPASGVNPTVTETSHVPRPGG